MAIANHWFSGAVTIPALGLAERFDRVEMVDIAVVIDRGDGTDPDLATIADFERAPPLWRNFVS